MFTTIFNLSLAESMVPACFKWSTIVSVPKTECLNDCQQVTLTSVVMKCFEKLKEYCTFLPPSMDPLQFAYQPNRSTDDAVSHLDSQKEGYVRMLFHDFSSRLIELGLNTHSAHGSWTF